MKIIATRRKEQNRAALDPWTVVHFSAGLALGLTDVSRGSAFGAALGYELAEQVMERNKWGKDLFETRGPESVANALVDTVVFLAGHWLGAHWLRT